MKAVEDALEWMLSCEENLHAFRADVHAVLSRFEFTDEEKQIIHAVHAKGLDATELEDAGLAQVEAQRSYGWSGPTTVSPRGG